METITPRPIDSTIDSCSDAHCQAMRTLSTRRIGPINSEAESACYSWRLGWRNRPAWFTPGAEHI